MRNSLLVFKRDLIRLLRAPAALVVVLVLAILPSVYTWYNVLGFWDPYENTGNLKVCVVDQDKGGSTELTGKLDVGEMIVRELRKNTQLDWQFTSFDESMMLIQSGQVYATFVIPEDFTERLLALTDGVYEQPEILYYVNEKAGPVAPKITDAGATTLDETVNSTFVATVSDAIVKGVDEAADAAKENALSAQSDAAAKIESACVSIQEGRSALAASAEQASAAQAGLAQVQDALASARTQADQASEALGTISSLATSLQEQLSTFSETATPAVSASLLAVSQAAAKANAGAGQAAADLQAANASISASAAEARALLAQSSALTQSLRDSAAQMPDSDPTKQGLLDAADALDAQAADLQAAITGAEALSQSVSDSAASIANATDKMDSAVQSATGSAQGVWGQLTGSLIPSAMKAASDVSAASSSLSAAVLGTKVVADQAASIVTQLDAALGTAVQATTATDGMLERLEGEMDVLRTDILAADGSQGLADALGIDGLDADAISKFMGAPTKVVTEELYPLNAYGSAMAPLFMNLTFWIGAFMLLVIMRQEVDSAGVPGLTLTQAYIGRFLLFALIACAQAVICCAGVLALGVQAVNAPALFAAAVVASLAYLSIIYALSVTLQHIGKGICIVLVFAQIPGATGLYPVEMTSGFFQAIYPLFPFTYGISAMRESICGFYGSQYATDLAVLALFFCLFMALGLGVRPYMSNVNRMVATQIRKSGIYNGERAEAPARPYRISQILRALYDRDEYKSAIMRRYQRFSKLYPRLIRGAVIAGICIPIAVSVVFALTPSEKVWVLTFWLVWLLVLILFLVVVESMRASINRQLKLDDMTDEGLYDLFAARGKVNDQASGSSVILSEAKDPALPAEEPDRRQGDRHA